MEFKDDSYEMIDTARGLRDEPSPGLREKGLRVEQQQAYPIHSRKNPATERSAKF